MKKKFVFLFAVITAVVSMVLIFNIEFISKDVASLFTNVNALAVHEYNASNALRAETHLCDDGVHEYSTCEPGDIDDSCDFDEEPDYQCPPNFSGYGEEEKQPDDNKCPAGGYHNWIRINGHTECSKCYTIKK